MRQLCFLALGMVFLTLPASLDAQSRPVTLEGRVTNRASDQPVPRVVLTLAGSGQRVMTDAVGEFAFDPTPIVGDTLLVSHEDFPGVRVPLGSLKTDWQIDLSLVPRTGRPEATSAAPEPRR